MPKRSSRIKHFESIKQAQGSQAPQSFYSSEIISEIQALKKTKFSENTVVNKNLQDLLDFEDLKLFNLNHMNKLKGFFSPAGVAFIEKRISDALNGLLERGDITREPYLSLRLNSFCAINDRLKAKDKTDEIKLEELMKKSINVMYYAIFVLILQSKVHEHQKLKDALLDDLAFKERFSLIFKNAFKNIAKNRNLKISKDEHWASLNRYHTLLTLFQILHPYPGKKVLSIKVADAIIHKRIHSMGGGEGFLLSHRKIIFEQLKKTPLDIKFTKANITLPRIFNRKLREKSFMPANTNYPKKLIEPAQSKAVHSSQLVNPEEATLIETDLNRDRTPLETPQGFRVAYIDIEDLGSNASSMSDFSEYQTVESADEMPPLKKIRPSSSFDVFSTNQVVNFYPLLNNHGMYAAPKFYKGSPISSRDLFNHSPDLIQGKSISEKTQKMSLNSQKSAPKTFFTCERVFEETIDYLVDLFDPKPK